MKAIVCLLLGIFATLTQAEERPEKKLNFNLQIPANAQGLLTPVYSKQKEVSHDWASSKKINYSIGVGGWSHHDTGNEPNRFNQKNPYLEFDIWIDYNLLGGRPLLGYGHIFRNSRNGTTDIIFLVNQWKLISGSYVDLCGGFGAIHIRYIAADISPPLPNRITGNVPFGYLCLEKKNLAVRFVPLGEKASFVYFVYSF